MKKKTGTKKTTEKKITELMRHQIGSINLSDLIDISTLTLSERKKYLQDAETLWNNPVFKNEIKFIIQKQIEFIGMEARDILEVSVGRGTVNGATLLSERIQALHIEYIEDTKPKEKFDEFGLENVE